MFSPSLRASVFGDEAVVGEAVAMAEEAVVVDATPDDPFAELESMFG